MGAGYTTLIVTDNQEDVVEMLSIPISPTRLKCAILCLDTLKNGILIYNKYQQGSHWYAIRS